MNKWKQKALEWAARGRKDSFRHADLRGANLLGVDLGPGEGKDKGADLRYADLREANLKGAHLEGADLGGADLRGANLKGAHLEVANLGGVNLKGASLWGADLERATVTQEQLEHAKDLTDAIMPDGRKWKGSEAGEEG